MLYIEDLMDQFEIEGEVCVRVFNSEEEEYVNDKVYANVFAIPSELRHLEIGFLYTNRDGILTFDILED